MDEDYNGKFKLEGVKYKNSIIYFTAMYTSVIKHYRKYHKKEEKYKYT